MSENVVSTSLANKELEMIAKLDRDLVEIMQGFTILTPLSWPKEAMDYFLSDIGNNEFKMPKIVYPKVDYSDKVQHLTSYISQIGNNDHPAIRFLSSTAESYLDAYLILQGAGTKDVTKYSRKLYGGPDDLMPGYEKKNLEIAEYFLKVVNDYKFNMPEEPLIYNAQQFCDALMIEVEKIIDQKKDPIQIKVDDSISARAAAGSTYVKIRKGARFSEADLKQLLHHEVAVHTLTYINGRRQPVLKSLGYSSPRTTATQEGLAVFAEYVNISIDLVRLKRIAQRIIAINMAEQGANFIDLFKFYSNNGQNNEESYYSAMRIFRGGVPEGGIIFYKDNVYLSGLIEVEAFLTTAMHNGNIHDISLLFSGKLTAADATNLKEFAKEGYIVDPEYLPPWAQKSSELAAHLAFNDLTEKFKLNNKTF
jgi:uncharacterized protein (TIGR02421 family)